MFIMSLAIADLTVGMIVMPISSAYAITGNWKFGIIVCQFWLSVDYSASTASILNLFILSLDRYWSIRSPLKYLRKRTKKRALIMIGIVWLVSAMWIVPIIGWHFWYNNGIRKQPSDVCETEFADNVFFKLTTSTANFYVPMLLMICLYVKIFSEIKKRSNFEIGQCNQRGKEINNDSINQPVCEIQSQQDSCQRNVRWHSTRSRIQGESRQVRNASTPFGEEFFECDEENQYSESSFTIEKREMDPWRDVNQINVTTSNHFSKSGKSNLKTVKGNRRYRHLTLLSVPMLNDEQGHQITPFHKQHFDDVTVNVEVVSDSGSEDKDLVFHENDKASTFHSRRQAFLSSSSTSPNTDAKPKRSRCGSGKSKSFLEKSYRPKINRNNLGQEDIELDSVVDQLLKPKASLSGKHKHCKNIKNSLYVKPCDSLAQRGTGSNIRAGSGFLPHLTTAFRVTRKSLASNLRQEKKAARQLGVIMGAFVLCWLPYIITFIVTAYCDDCIDPKIHTATIWLGYLNSTMNPFLYALCNDNFKRAFKKMIRRSSSYSKFFPAFNSTRTDHLFA
ncbi:histamine H1 receptor-like [Limulus polyphemus]|uniref:Histamine H1 receptor-like n=1 Tax=Limulus polyphemus TaxID=6850 RepID=A0ABM1BDS2_LIMPO|nr:histamine H1 receptor-like [Limulus polyphemus]